MGLKQFFSAISVEPALFFYMCNYHLVEFLYKNLFIQKECRFNNTIEPDLSTECDDNDKGILFASKVNSHYHSVASLLCIIYVIVAVCWSDKSGRRRRPLILLPIVGQILETCSGSMHSYFWSWHPSYAIMTKMIGEVVGGSRELMVTAAQMYVCDISKLESRTMRVGFVWLIRSVGMPLGKGGSGFILRRVGFYYSFLLSVVLSFVSLALALIFVKNTSVRDAKKVSLRETFDFTPIVESFKIVFKRSLARKRIIILLLLLVQLFAWFTAIGENSMVYLFLKHRFKWNEEEFSLFQIYRYALFVPGTMFCSVVLSKWLKIHDGVIGAFAAFFDTITVIGYTIAFESWHIYAASVFDMFHGSALSVGSSFASKFYQSHEFGRLFAVIHVFGLLVPASLPLYNIVFRKTLKTFPSSFYLISLVLDIGVVLSYWISYRIDEKTSREKPPVTIDTEEAPMVSVPLINVVNYQDEISPKKSNEDENS